MNKNQKEYIAFIILVTVILNYAFYNFCLGPDLRTLNEKKISYNNTKQTLDKIEAQSKNLNSLNKELQKMKAQISSIDAEIPKNNINTPQLVYDFYNSCKKYNLDGSLIKFQLDNKSASTSGSGSTSGNSANLPVGLERLTFELKASGNKSDAESFIRNLSNITSRTIAVESISLTAGVDSSSNQNSTSAQSSTQNNSPSQETQLPSDVIPGQATQSTQDPQSSSSAADTDSNSSDKVTLTIIFYQYLQLDNSQSNTTKKYGFYNGASPYNSISDMLK